MQKEMTAMQQFIQWYEDYRKEHLANPNYFQIKNKATSLLPVEKQQIVDARISVTGLNHASPTDDNSLEDAEKYYNDKFTQK